MLQFEEEKTSPTRIKVIGVGGGGMNAVNRMIDSSLTGVDFMVVNTDEQVLRKSEAPEKLTIGMKTTKGMGAGGDPEIGLKAAEEDRDRLLQAMKGYDMVFITAGMGGGTGTGAAPVVARVARELGALTVGVVTLPFSMEGAKRMAHARRGLEALKGHVDTLITIKNDSIFKVIDRAASVDIAFRLVDEILLNAVKGISDLINTAGLVNVDFADVRSIMGETGDAIMGSGEGIGENKVSDAVDQAIHNALLEDTSIEGATAVLINVCGGSDMSITEWKDVSELITAHVAEDANIIVGLTIDEELYDRIRVTVIATGFRRGKKADLSTYTDSKAVSQVLGRPGKTEPEPAAEPAPVRSGWRDFDIEDQPADERPAPAVSIRSRVENRTFREEIPVIRETPDLHEDYERPVRPEREPARAVSGSVRRAVLDERAFDKGDLEIPAFLRRRKN